MVSCASTPLEVLSEEDLVAAVPWAIIRANDWVSQLRRAGRRVLHKAVREKNLNAIAASAPLWERLSSWSRDDHSELLSSLANILLDEEGFSTLQEYLLDSDVQVRRALARQCPKLDDAAFMQLGKILIQDRHPGLRGIVAHNLSRFGESAKIFEEKLYADSVATFNLLALESELRRDPSSAAKRLPNLVFHRSSVIRYLARHRLAEREKIEDPRAHFAELYRSELISETRQTLIAIAGLAEVGEKSDIETLKPLLKSERSKMVRATLKSIRKLAPSEAVEPLKSMLGDSRPGVRHDALRLLRGGLSDEDAELVLSIGKGKLASADPKHIIQLAENLPFWMRVLVLLNLAPEAKDQLRDLVLQSLETILDQSQEQLPPRGSLQQNLPKALRNAKSALPQELFKEFLLLKLPFAGGTPFMPKK